MARGRHFLLLFNDFFLAWSIITGTEVSFENEQNSLCMLRSSWKSDVLCLCVMEMLSFGEILSMRLFHSENPTGWVQMQCFSALRGNKCTQERWLGHARKERQHRWLVHCIWPHSDSAIEPLLRTLTQVPLKHLCYLELSCGYFAFQVYMVEISNAYL